MAFFRKGQMMALKIKMINMLYKAAMTAFYLLAVSALIRYNFPKLYLSLGIVARDPE